MIRHPQPRPAPDATEIVEVWCVNDGFRAVGVVDGASYCATCYPFAVASLPEEDRPVTTDSLTGYEEGYAAGYAAALAEEGRPVTEPRTVHFTFDGEASFEGVLAGGEWNGFTNVKVTPEVRDAIIAAFAAAYEDGIEPDAESLDPDYWPPVGDDGLVDLSGGYATSLVPLSLDECDYLGADGRDGRGYIHEANLSDAEYRTLAIYRRAVAMKAAHEAHEQPAKDCDWCIAEALDR